MVTTSSQLSSVQRPKDWSARTETPFWRYVYGRYGAHLGFGAAAIVLILGWLGRETRALSAESGLGYALGFVAVACMTLLLVYPLRKRWRWLGFLGPTKNWFRAHMMLGTLGPLAGLYHCNFSLGSFNSRLALFSALLVAASGFVGRYIYAKIHVGLYGRRANLQELLAQVKGGSPVASRIAPFVAELNDRLSAFDRRVLTPPTGLLASISLPLRLAILTRLEHSRLQDFVQRKIFVDATRSPVLKEHGARFEAITCDFIASHLQHVRRVAEFTAYQRLFALWHKVHLPFFVVLVLSTAVHIYAVQFY